MNDSRQFFSTRHFPTPKIGDIIEYSGIQLDNLLPLKKSSGLVVETNLNGYAHLALIHWFDTNDKGTVNINDCKVIRKED